MGSDRLEECSLKSKFDWMKLPLLSVILSILAFYPRYYPQLSPLWFLPAHSSDIVTPLGRNWLTLTSSNSTTLLALKTSSTACVAVKPELLKSPEFYVSKPLQYPIRTHVAYEDCRSSRSCKMKLLFLDDENILALLDNQLNPTWKRTLDFQTPQCVIRDVALHIVDKDVFIFASLESHRDQSCSMKFKAIKVSLADGKLQLNLHLTGHDLLGDWTRFSASLSGKLHQWHTSLDTAVTTDSVITNAELELVQEAKEQTLTNEPSIKEVYFTDSIVHTFIHNALVVHHSEGLLALDKNTLEYIINVPLPRDMANNSIFLISDDEIRSFSLVDNGSQVNTIGIPRLFAEARTLGESENVFTKLLSVQDLSGMTIEQSLEELKFLQPPLAFNPRKSSQLDPLSFLNFASITGYKVMFHIGNGNVKAYDMDGNLFWKSESHASWQSKLSIIRSNPEIHNSFYPQIKRLATLNAIVIQGFEHLSLLSQLSGQEVTYTSLPSHPIGPMLIHDFNHDSFEDIVVHTTEGFIGFAVCSSISNTQFWGFIIAIAAILFFMFIGFNVKRFNSD